MLGAASKQMNRCRELGQALLELEAHRRSAVISALTSRECDAQARRAPLASDTMPPFDPYKLQNALDRMETVYGDLETIRELYTEFCHVNRDEGILPCLAARLGREGEECKAWWLTVRNSPLVVWK